ncbi:cytochrome c [Cupriavidus sp. WKF15]|uniref:c-type cytochrome n=1 Tax=Cupriavidus sp. WKF15 TaxID=3032282 RepID=UPI0023E2B10C|nr:cytochrome c [Cupriavidus sp. WKF15]WER50941.1 cytochrome c [Cupriavidus sp. WKF15]
MTKLFPITVGAFAAFVTVAAGAGTPEGHGAPTPSAEPVAATTEPSTSALSPPFSLNDPARIENGRKRFGSTCAAYCHGTGGQGGRAPSFTGRTDFVPADAFKTIAEGRTGADVMPPWSSTFKSEQIWELVAYLQYLSKQPATR